MSADPQRFATVVLAAFAHAGRHTDTLIAKANGPSTSTMTKLRKVARGEEDMPEPREPTWSKIDNAANWKPGSARRVWAGLEPEIRDSVGGVTQDAGYVSGPGATVEGGVRNEDLLREIRQSREEYDRLRSEVGSIREGLQYLGNNLSQRLDALSERVATLEQQSP